MAAPAIETRSAPTLGGSDPRRLPPGPAAPHLAAPSLPAPSLTVPGHQRNVSRTRAFVRAVLGDGHPLTDAATLIVSELVTNAILHSRSHEPSGTVTVSVSQATPGVLIEVTDAGSADRVPRIQGDSLGTRGRGLLLVDAFARDWGFVRQERGTTVWCHLTP